MYIIDKKKLDDMIDNLQEISELPMINKTKTYWFTMENMDQSRNVLKFLRELKDAGLKFEDISI